MPEYTNYINGEWVESVSDETLDVVNPADTDDVVGTFQQSNEEDTNRAVDAAVEAGEEWANTPGPSKGAILRGAARRLEDREDELTELLTREEGKTLSEAGGEVGRAINIFYY
jgi:2,5-dioxopentanoate dehydrogenase